LLLLLGSSESWDRCFDFENIFAQNILQKNWHFLFQSTASLCKNLLITLVFEKTKRQFFRRKLAKIAENCDCDIDPKNAAKISAQTLHTYL
jgi:hypothetical protein